MDGKENVQHIKEESQKCPTDYDTIIFEYLLREFMRMAVDFDGSFITIRILKI